MQRKDKIDIHLANRKEFDQLCQIWHDEFKSSLTYIKTFYELVNAIPYVLVINNEVVSCLTLVNSGTYKNKQIMVSYAITTKPNFRNKSYGKELITYVKEKVLSEGHLSLVCPAKPNLIKFYNDLGYKSTFFANEITCHKTEDSNVSINYINKKQYQNHRESLLKNFNHVLINKSMLSFIQSKKGDKQQFISINNNNAICILDNNQDTIYLPELLIGEKSNSNFDNDLLTIINSICTFCNKKSIKVRYFNVNNGLNKKYTQGMLAGLNNNSKEIAYYGFPMD